MPSPNHKARRSGSLTLAGTGAAVRRGDLKISDPIPFEEGGLGFNSPTTVPPSSYLQPAGDAPWPRKSTLTQDVHVRHVSDVQPHMGVRASAGPSLFQSSMSSAPSKGSLNQKKPGGLRAAIRRMFSSKRHRSVPTNTSSFSYSDSGHLNSVIERQGRTRLDSTPPFSADYGKRGAALASHATNYQQAEVVDQNLPPPRRGRRNTLPSLVFGETDPGVVSAITDRALADPAAKDEQAKENTMSDRQFKRRSRSADALKDLIRQNAADERPSNQDRAGTIAFWRNSAIQNPVPVFSGQSIAVDPVHLQPSSSIGKSQQMTSAMSPMQTFDFGLGNSEKDDITLEQRLGTLEIKIFDFEFALAKLQGHNIPNPRLKPRPFSGGSIHDIFEQNETNLTLATDSSNSLSYHSPIGAPSPSPFLNSPGESPLLSTEGDEVFRPQRASKATTVTIRPANARRASPTHSRVSSRSSIHIPAHKFEALLDLVKEEKAARLKLEDQVRELQKEMEVLRTPVYATIRDAYPTPSPDSSQANPATPRMRPLHRTPPFSVGHPHIPEISRFSGTEDSDVEEDDGEDDEGYEDVYETPRQEQRNTFETARDSPRAVKV